MDLESYTEEEVIKLGNEPPVRGILCPRCKSHIPEFTNLTTEDAEAIRQLVRSGRLLEPMQELRRLTGCSLLWAKIWTLHPDGPDTLEDKKAPCPFCGKPLRTERSKQCRHCKRDWHDSKMTFLEWQSPLTRGVGRSARGGGHRNFNATSRARLRLALGASNP